MKRSVFGFGLVVAGVVVAGAAGSAFGAESATVTYTAQLISGSTYHYNFTIQDTGSTTIGTLWYGWVPGYNFLEVAPTNLDWPAGWTGLVDHTGIFGGYSVQWTVASPPAAEIGQSGSLSGFGFDSTESPLQLGGTSTLVPNYPEAYSYVYSGGPELDSGAFLSATQVPLPTPEPGSLALLGVGALMLGRRGRRVVG